MSNLVNLRKARKLRRRKDADAKAAANRVLHGQTRQERTRQQDETDRRRSLLDGKRLDTGDGSTGDAGSTG